MADCDALFPNVKVPELQKFSKGRDIQISVNSKMAEKGRTAGAL